MKQQVERGVAPSLAWLSDPGVFAVGRMPAHSDHRYYESMLEAEQLGDALAPQSEWELEV